MMFGSTGCWARLLGNSLYIILMSYDGIYEGGEVVVGWLGHDGFMQRDREWEQRSGSGIMIR